ncbi:putative uncharacterized protein DDB_G0268364 [Drosophila busckii]|uniref:putative uncharacterized protein DDB_G0268364 n=1 Tax=Drosophila busckii TaxID=30019 RepID=UPI00083E9FC9|nr:putative uncharacterized protein DDB_G0268364 [Drosophila busckii]
MLSLAAVVCVLVLVLAALQLAVASENSLIPSAQQLELKLGALHVQQQLLQEQIEHVYASAYTPDKPLLLQQLQQRQQELQLQVLRLTNKHKREQEPEPETDAEPAPEELALHLQADFEYLQHKLDELKQQLQRLSKNATAPAAAQRNVAETATPTTPSPPTHFWSPLLNLPESLAPSPVPSSTTPSLIRRFMTLLRRPQANANSMLRNNFPDPQKLQTLSAEQLLAQLQRQRQYLDESIRRLEQLTQQQQQQQQVDDSNHY